jgi:hypothetical protein
MCIVRLAVDMLEYGPLTHPRRQIRPHVFRILILSDYTLTAANLIIDLW